MPRRRRRSFRRLASAALIGAGSLFDLDANEHWARSRRDLIQAEADADDEDASGNPPIDPPGAFAADRAAARERVQVRPRQRWWHRRRR
ncbi:MAG: hypothetical protein KDB35_23580 [Acidimicrobiales bacterium]|nr:hypothetical protein [Acidimicrobiales bacterium]